MLEVSRAEIQGEFYLCAVEYISEAMKSLIDGGRFLEMAEENSDG